MEYPLKLQGRTLCEMDVKWIRQQLEEHPEWHRSRLSREICVAWRWADEQGRLKDMACRTMLLKLEEAGAIRLPAPQNRNGNGVRYKRFEPVLHGTEAVACELSGLRPLQVEVVKTKGPNEALWITLVRQYHYLGYGGTVGENLRYLVSDREGRPLACLLFGAAAWKAQGRDRYIGWSVSVRERNLQKITNNTRFLILPWVRVAHLASHVLGLVARRIGRDWEERYGHGIYLLETFVERERYRGSCYRAANWEWVGSTQGRSRQDREHRMEVGVKEHYVYPLRADFRRWLNE